MRFLVGFGLVGVLVSSADFSDLTIDFDAGVVAGLLLAVILLACALFLSAIRWNLVLGRSAPSVGALWRIYMIGWFFSLFLPTSVGGDAVRAVALSRSQTGTGAALSSIVVERLLGVLALGAYLLLGLVLAPAVLLEVMGYADFTLSPALITVAVLAIPTGMAGLLLVARRVPRLGALVRDAIQLLSDFRVEPGRFALAVGVSLLVQGLYIIVWLVLAWRFGIAVPVLAMLVFVPFVSLAAMLPVTLSGLGVREGAWVLLLASYGVTTPDAIAFSLAYYVASLLLGGGGGLLFAFSGIRIQGASTPHVDRHTTAADAPVRPARKV